MADKKQALGILERAINIEEEGRKFYQKAAEKTQDTKGKELFARLASDEVKHHDLIKKQQDALNAKGEWVGSDEIKPVKLDLARQLFPPDRKALEAKITAKSNDWDAIMFALEIEVRSFELYRNSAMDLEDPLGKQMFEFLSGEEMDHYNNLITLYESLFGSYNS